MQSKKQVNSLKIKELAAGIKLLVGVSFLLRNIYLPVDTNGLHRIERSHLSSENTHMECSKYCKYCKYCKKYHG